MIILLQIFSWFWHWKNLENRLIFDEVKAYKRWCQFYCANFLGHPVCYRSVVCPSLCMPSGTLMHDPAKWPMDGMRCHLAGTRVVSHRTKVTVAYGASRTRVHNFLLVINSNLGSILPRFSDIADFLLKPTSVPHLYSNWILGVFLWTRSPMLGLRAAKTLSCSGGGTGGSGGGNCPRAPAERGRRRRARRGSIFLGGWFCCNVIIYLLLLKIAHEVHEIYRKTRCFITATCPLVTG